MSSCNLQHAEGHNLLAALGRPGRAGPGRALLGTLNLRIHHQRIKPLKGFYKEIKDKVDLIKENLTDN